MRLIALVPGFIDCKEALYPVHSQRMSEETFEQDIRRLLESHNTTTVTVAWRGGEPTLTGLPFFQHAMQLVEIYRRPGQEVHHTFQTNGISLDDRWCAFFRKYDVLVGLSVDGPQEIHNRYRLTYGDKGAFNLVMRGLSCLRKHGVRFNIVCTVNASNQHHGRSVYRFFRDELEADWIQFIPMVERATPETPGIAVTSRSVHGRQYGQFLIEIFEEWIRRDVGRIFVQPFDVTIEAHLGRYTPCIHARRRDRLTSQCRNCDVRHLCNGGCPKDRFVRSRDNERGHNYLCSGLELFYRHTRPVMETMAGLVREGRPAAEVMQWVSTQDAKRGPKEPCPCGSGLKFELCHGHTTATAGGEVEPGVNQFSSCSWSTEMEDRTAQARSNCRMIETIHDGPPYCI